MRWARAGRTLRGREGAAAERTSLSAPFINPFDDGAVAEGSRHSWRGYLGFPRGFPLLPGSRPSRQRQPLEAQHVLLRKRLLSGELSRKKSLKEALGSNKFSEGAQAIENGFL